MKSINPATGETIAEFSEYTDEEVQRRLQAAALAQRTWREWDFAERSAAMRRVAAMLRRELEPHARLITGEMGKPISQARIEVEKCAVCCDYFAEHAAGFLASERVPTEFSRSEILFQPLGVVFAIMPWNFPFWQVVRAAAPALMAGNALVLKHASNVCGCALALERVFREAALPAGVFTTLLLASPRAESLMAHPTIAAATLTGSTEAGRKVAAAAGAQLKKTVLELGGSDAYLVLDDANLEAAAATCAASRLINSGQSCIAAKRFIVMRSVREAFENHLVARMRAARVGDPTLAETQVGPLARHDLRDSLHEQVERSLAAGARLLTGGRVPPGPGAFYPPTALSHIRPGMAAFDEETFGPVAAVIEAKDEAHAIELANQTSFGLGAAVFTGDPERGARVAAQLEAGACFVNDFVRSDPRLPFGGIKQSGYGRELGLLGIREFVNAKILCVR